MSIQEPRQLQARGSIFNARFTDRKSPIAYGYDETLPIYFNQAPLFQVAAAVVAAAAVAVVVAVAAVVAPEAASRDAAR